MAKQSCARKTLLPLVYAVVIDLYLLQDSSGTMILALLSCDLNSFYSALSGALLSKCAESNPFGYSQGSADVRPLAFTS